MLRLNKLKTLGYEVPLTIVPFGFDLAPFSVILGYEEANLNFCFDLAQFTVILGYEEANLSIRSIPYFILLILHLSLFSLSYRALSQSTVFVKYILFIGPK